MNQSILTKSYIPAVLVALVGFGVTLLPFDRIDRSEKFKAQEYELKNDVRQDLDRVNEMAVLFKRIEGSKQRIVYNADDRGFEAFNMISGIVSDGVKNMKVETISKAQAATALEKQITPSNDNKVNEFREQLKSALLATAPHELKSNQYDSLNR